MKLSQIPTIRYSALAVSFLAMLATAQNTVPNLSSALESQSQAANTVPVKTSASNTGSPTLGTNAPTVGGTSINAVITGAGESNTATGAIPSIVTGGASATDGGGLPVGLPTLAGAYKIVAASVPPTSNAPYMRSSNVPEGTVFIIVGAILGFLAMTVLLWRALTAWALHRSVKRANQHQDMADTKALFQTPAAPFYKFSDRDSMISLTGIGGKGGKGNKKATRPTTAPGAASASSLFFSPTAGAAGAGMQNPGNRGSNYLPAGYYAAGASAPGNAQSHISLGQGHGPSISLSNLGPQRDGYGRARSMGPSPPGSPGLNADGNGMQSSSTLNLNRGYGGDERAPSAYLEDLFDGDGAPHIPGQQPSQRQSGRF